MVPAAEGDFDPFAEPKAGAAQGLASEDAAASEGPKGQFSIHHLLLLTFLCAVFFAAAGNMLRGVRSGGMGGQYFNFVLMTLLAPPATLIAVSLYYENVLQVRPVELPDED